MKVCTKCKTRYEDEKANFYKSRHNKDGLHFYCKDCQDEQTRARRALVPMPACLLASAWTTKVEVRDD